MLCSGGGGDGSHGEKNKINKEKNITLAYPPIPTFLVWLGKNQFNDWGRDEMHNINPRRPGCLYCISKVYLFLATFLRQQR